MKKAIILATFILSFVMQSAFASAYVYDDFSTGTLNTSKWTEEIAYNGIAHVDEHYVNTTEQAYHTAQLTHAHRGTFLKMDRLINTGETVEFDVMLHNISGNAQSWIWYDGPPENGTYTTPCSTPSSGCGIIGHWNGDHDVGSSLGRYHIKLVYGENHVNATYTRPDNTTLEHQFVLTPSSTHMFGVATRTGHNGIIHVDYDNFTIGASIESTWWDSDWQYRRIITVDNSGGSLTDYQIAINVTYDSDMQSDFDDIRFVDTGNTELSYWLQEKSNPEWAYFWVKIPSIPAISIKDIYMYYGNPSASSESDIQNTMIIGDDFDDNSLNTTKWNNSANCGNYEENNGYVNITCTATSNSYNWFYSNDKTINDGILETKMMIDSNDNIWWYEYHPVALSSSDTHGNDINNWWWNNQAGVWVTDSSDFDSPNYIDYDSRSNGTYTDTRNFDYSDYQTGSWFTLKIVRNVGHFNTYYKNNTFRYNHTTNLFNGAARVVFDVETGAATPSYPFWSAFDWIFVREYASLEPTYSIGIEESTTPTPPEPECNCTKLTEKVSELEEEVEDLKDRVEILEENQGTVSPHTHSISDIIGLQGILDSIQNNLNKLIVLLTELPRGFRQQMVCGYMKTTSTNSLDALGLHCEMKKICHCKDI
jgi:hypothetical protein